VSHSAGKGHRTCPLDVTLRSVLGFHTRGGLRVVAGLIGIVGLRPATPSTVTCTWSAVSDKSTAAADILLLCRGNSDQILEAHMAASAPMPQLRQLQEVVVTDIHMPFRSMVTFMVKWAVASIPAMIILIVLGAFFWAFALAVFSSFTGSKAASSLITPSITDASVIRAHEESVIASIKAVDEAEMIYASSHPNSGFTSNLARLGRTTQGGEGLVDNDLATGRKSGYTFTYTPGEKVNGAIRSYTVTAVPDHPGSTGDRRFYSDESSEIHYNISGPADATSPVIGAESR